MTIKTKSFFLLLLTLGSFFLTYGQNQLPKPALIGYFHNWNSKNVPYLPLDQVDDRYDVIIVAFAMPISGTTYTLDFEPFEISPEEFKIQIKTLQKKGKKVLISVGGATAQIKINSNAEKNLFVYSLTRIIDEYGFDGYDIDLEGKSVSISGGTITEIADPSIQFLTDAIGQVKTDYKKAKNKNLILTFAPETAYAQGGQTRFKGIWGAYLPILDALRNEIDLLQVQLYNSGTMYGVNEIIYQQGTADFIVAMTDA